MTRRITYSIASGSIERLSQKQTHDYMDDSIQELAKLCDITMVRVSSRGNWRYSFRNEWDMQTPALGNAYRNGVIHIASKTTKDRWRMDLPFRRTLQTVTQHEGVAHVTPFNLGHTAERLGILGTSANSPGPLPAEVRRMQQKVGEPENTFYPVDRAIISQRKAAEGDLDNDVIRLKAERQALIDAAQGLTGNDHSVAWAKIHAKHREVVAVHKRLVYYFTAWWAANNHWAGVPKAHVSGRRTLAAGVPEVAELQMEPPLLEDDTLYDGEIYAFFNEDGEE